MSSDTIREDEKHLAARKVVLIQDHVHAGFTWPIWVSDGRYVAQLRNNIGVWVEDHQGLVSYDAWNKVVLISFKTRDDAMMFKLMYGGQ
jgi:hypothetical protein